MGSGARHGLRAGNARRPFPRQRLRGPPGHRRGHAPDTAAKNPDDRGPGAFPRRSSTCASTARGWCWSPDPTGSGQVHHAGGDDGLHQRTRPATSSPSRTRSNSCIPTGGASSTSAKCASTPRSFDGLRAPCAKTRTSCWWGNARPGNHLDRAETAETGQLVFGTLHTNNAPSTWTASSTSSRPTGRRRSAPCCRRASGRGFPDALQATRRRPGGGAGDSGGDSCGRPTSSAKGRRSRSRRPCRPDGPSGGPMLNDSLLELVKSSSRAGQGLRQVGRQGRVPPAAGPRRPQARRRPSAPRRRDPGGGRGRRSPRACGGCPSAATFQLAGQSTRGSGPAASPRASDFLQRLLREMRGSPSISRSPP